MTRLGWTCPTCATPYVVPDLVCGTCGIVAGPLRWMLSTVERMCMYSTYFGFPPSGKHRRVADHLWAEFGMVCAACEGTGGVPPVLLDEWQQCRACAGHGRLPAPNSPQMRELREIVIDVIRIQTTLSPGGPAGGRDE